jgi:bifunctional UDP-N-acetylglucosamine pyrophosphorylase/glucosamine-1-phosphate N-acetyltransferase
VILIVGYLKEVVQRHFGNLYGEKKITYVEQQELNGTAGALWSAQSVLRDRFLVMMGDDIYMREDVERCIAPSEHWRLLVQQLSEMHRAGSVELDENANIIDIIESREEDEFRLAEGLASTNLYILDTRLFSCPLVPKHFGSSEYGLPQTVVAAARQLGVVFEPIFTDKWIQITAPKDLVAAAAILKNQKK